MTWWIALLAFAAADPPSTEALTARLSEEAEVFFRVAPQTLSQETLRQRAAVARRRFLPRIGKAALERDIHYKTQEVVSEYTFGSFRESPGALHEFRRIVSVDGRPVASRENARTMLTLGMRSPDDGVKRRLLDEFAAAGLIDPVTDFGPLILLFQRRQLANYRFRYLREGLLGAQVVVVYGYEQVRGDGALSVFSGRQLLTFAVQGEIWSRRSDLAPVRIVMRAEREGGRRDEATVDYFLSSHGVILPSSVVHTGWEGDLLLVENRFQYAPFRRFTADAEIKFTEVPQP